jgi:hypothetical protein
MRFAQALRRANICGKTAHNITPSSRKVQLAKAA